LLSAGYGKTGGSDQRSESDRDVEATESIDVRGLLLGVVVVLPLRLRRWHRQTSCLWFRKSPS
jgi:hypothetical protein